MMRGMSQTSIGFLLGGMFVTIGAVLLVVVRLLARLNVWGQSQVSKLPVFKKFAKFAHDEQTSITFIRGIGVAAIVAGFLVPIIAIAMLRTW
jgi:hypothetical protein